MKYYAWKEIDLDVFREQMTLINDLHDKNILLGYDVVITGKFNIDPASVNSHSKELWSSMKERKLTMKDIIENKDKSHTFLIFLNKNSSSWVDHVTHRRDQDTIKNSQIIK